MQQELWHDTINDALLADINAVGGVKKVAGLLWPSLPSETAATRLRNGLNHDQPQKLAPDEVIAIKRLAASVGSFATLQFEAQQLGFTFELIAPADEATALQRELRDLLKATNQRMARLEKIQGAM